MYIFSALLQSDINLNETQKCTRNTIGVQFEPISEILQLKLN